MYKLFIWKVNQILFYFTASIQYFGYICTQYFRLHQVLFNTHWTTAVNKVVTLMEGQLTVRAELCLKSPRRD